MDINVMVRTPDGPKNLRTIGLNELKRSAMMRLHLCAYLASAGGLSTFALYLSDLVDPTPLARDLTKLLKDYPNYPKIDEILAGKHPVMILDIKGD